MASGLLSILLFAAAVLPRPESEPRATAVRADSPFPIGVWLQSPQNAERYKAIGINHYVGLWRGPTEDQLVALDKAGMKLICAQTPTGLKWRNPETIVAWMHGDEPDNAQSLGRGKGYGPPIAPAKIVEDYQKLKKADPRRPVFLNLGQGVAWDGYFGRGVRTNHPEDYAEYLKGCDVASFDIYPVVHDKAAVAGKLEFVPNGVERLRKWTDDEKPVWCCIETTGIGNAKVRPTPRQVKSEVWLALIHRAKGIVYFAHEFQPKFVEAGLLAEPSMAKGVEAINRQIQELAPALAAPEAKKGRVAVESSDPAVPVDFAVRDHDGSLYVFAASARAGKTSATFRANGDVGSVEVLGEGRTLATKDGAWTDRFSDYEVRLYRVASKPGLP